MGDGGFQINLQELQLLALKKLNVKLFVFNNGTLGLIKTSQDKYFGDRHHGSAAPDFGCPGLEHIAHAYGLSQYKIETPSDLSQLDMIFSDARACLVEVMVDPAFPLMTRHDMKDVLAASKVDE
jgi:acetolactate synthase-1/2/3 large subunit